MSALGGPASPTCSRPRLEVAPEQDCPTVRACLGSIQGPLSGPRRIHLSTHRMFISEPTGTRLWMSTLPALCCPEGSPKGHLCPQSPLDTSGSITVFLASGSVSTCLILESTWGQAQCQQDTLPPQGYLMPKAEPANVIPVSKADANVSTHLPLTLTLTWPPGWARPVNGRRTRREFQFQLPHLLPV